MRALVLVVATTACACRPDLATTTAHDPGAASVRVRLVYGGRAYPRTRSRPPTIPTVSNVLAPPTPATACFAEPVTYSRRVRVKPMAGDADGRLLQCDTSTGESARACRLRMAREYFKANRFERAGPLFLAAAHDATAPDAPLAAQLAFESMNMLAVEAEPSRPTCYDLMVEELPKLLDELCRPEPRFGAGEVCAMLHLADADAVSCSECTGPTVTGRSPWVAYASAGRIYLELANERCVFAKGRQARNDERRCDDLLFRAYSSFSRGNDVSHAAQARALLMDPKNGLRHSRGAKRLVEIEERQRAARRFSERFGRP